MTILSTKMDMKSWIHVVTQPLGLAGFALFLVFSFVGKNRKGKKPDWMSPAAFFMAAICIAAGIALDFRQTPNSSKPALNQEISKIQQTATGTSNSNVAGVQGNVSVSISSSDTPALGGSTPLSASDVLALLKQGTNDQVLRTEVQRRGITFHVSVELVKQFRAAGASKELLSVLQENSRP